LRLELEKHLSSLHRQRKISSWHDRLIVPGTDWAKTINTRLQTASLILLLISADFLASDYCYSIEMKRALERDQAGEARVVPVLLRPADWQGSPFEHLQALPTDGKAVTIWPNRDEAFADVAIGIRRAIEDLTLLRTSSSHNASLPDVGRPYFPDAFPAVWNVPHRHKDYFTGREQDIKQIHKIFMTPSLVCPVVAIGGPGGMGKTQTAAEYAYLYRADYQCILWIKAETSATFSSDLVAAARLLNLPESYGHDQRQVLDAIKRWLSTNSHWLLIFDNAEGPSIVNDFLPTAARGHVLVTTRAEAMGGFAKPRFPLEKLDAETGGLFLLRRATIIEADASREATTAEKYGVAKALSERLGGLPLALDQAGAYIEDTGCSLARYLKLYQTRSDEIQRMRFGPIPDYPEPVATTWTISRARVQARYPAAVDLLCFCAFLYPETIPEVILTKGASELSPPLQSEATDPIKLDLLLSELRKFSLIARSGDGETQTLSIHRLLQDVQKAELTQEEQRIWAQRVVRAVNKTVQNSPAVSLHRDLYVQAKACIPLIQQWNMHFPEARHLWQWLEQHSL
jgi:hypothetical protein